MDNHVTGGPSLEVMAPGVTAVIAAWYAWPQLDDAGDEDNGHESGTIGQSQTDTLVRYADDSELFHTPEQEPYTTFDIDGHSESWAVESRRFELYLRRRYFEDHGRAPKAQPVKDAIATIAARAIFAGPERRVFVRLAGHEGAVYLDLCNELWEAVEITQEGWRVVARPPVKFTRNNTSAPLPRPVRGGSVDELRRFLSVDDQTYRLIVGWLLGTFNPEGPYPVLEVNGQQGTAKSTVSRALVALVDPAVAPLRALPTNERDLAIAAKASWVLAFDNVSYIRPEMSDAMCRLSTGGGFATRRLYTDDEEAIFDAKRALVLNGINAVLLRGDLQERSVRIVLDPIPPEWRLPEREFWRASEETRPRILGALLDAVSWALRNLDRVRLEEYPRMADFAAWVTAAEGALGWEPGSFMEAYANNRRQASEAVLENDGVAAALSNLQGLREDGAWSGTAENLLDALNRQASEELKRSKWWPKAPNSLIRRINRIAPALKEAGIDYYEHEEGREKRKIKTLRRRETASGADGRRDAPEAPGEAAEGGSHAAVDEGDADDDGEDHLAELAERGWHRDDHALDRSPEDLRGGGIDLRTDPVARELRHRVPIDYGPHAPWNVPICGPQVFDAEGAWNWQARGKTEEELRSMGWPASPEEMGARLERVIPLLQERPYPFSDPRIADFYMWESDEQPGDPEVLCTKGRLHAELWRNEETSEELYALIALLPGWSPPRREIEEAVAITVANRNPVPYEELEITEDDGSGFVF